MTKTIDENFRDWESNAFGFGYGTGEEHTLAAIKKFFELCNEGSYGQSYDYQKLEAALTPTVAWLLISTFGHLDIIEYGCSPRYAWLTKKGVALKEYLATKTAEELYEICTGHDESYTHCSPKYCNCGERGYEEGRICVNPFWKSDRP